MTEGILLASSDTVDMIKGLYKYEVFGQEVWITTSHVCILIVWLSLVIFSLIANHKLKHATEVPDTFQSILELIVSLLDGMVEGSMGKHAPVFANWICTIFCFILVSNLSGLVGLRPPTADYGTTLALALITFVCIHVVKIRHQSAKDIWIDKCSPHCGTNFYVTTFVCKRSFRNYHYGSCVWIARQVRAGMACSTSCVL